MPVDVPDTGVKSGPSEPTTDLTWSKPIDGVRVRLIGSHPSVRAGQPFELDFRVENCGDQMRSIELPLVRRAILPAAQPAPPKMGQFIGDLRITAEQIGGEKLPPAPAQLIAAMPQFGPFPVNAGGQLWITVSALPPGSVLPAQPFKVFGGGRRANLNVPMLHLGEYSSFPALTRPGKYRLTATFTAADPGTDAMAIQMGMIADGTRNMWSGTIESPPIELEVLPVESESK
jgi:hypothetical protein